MTEADDKQSDIPVEADAQAEVPQTQAEAGNAVENTDVSTRPADASDAHDDPERGSAAAEKHADGDDGEREKQSAFVEELIKIGVKTVAVALSVVMLLLSILTVALPLAAMRAFNKLGMSERAMNSGDRYIVRRLDKLGVDEEDELGNYIKAGGESSLSDADMTEALTVCIGLADSLMKDSDGKTAVYFANKLDRYIRVYLSLSGIRLINNEKNKSNIAHVSPVLRPFVYDYSHTLKTLDYAARAVMGKTDVMLYDPNRDGYCVTTVDERSQSFAGFQFDTDVSKQTVENRLDDYVDYIDQLGAYLAAVQKRFNVSGLITETEEDRKKYEGVLSGDEFSVFITPEDGFTVVFDRLLNATSSLGYNFTRYAQAAVDYEPTTLDEQLHRLYWLRIFAQTSDRLLNLGRILQFNRNRYGLYADKINEYYSTFTFDNFRLVRANGDTAVLATIYNTAIAEYMANFTD